MATSKQIERRKVKREINAAQEPVMSGDIKDIPLLLACILRELETNNKYLKLLSKLECMDHGVES